MEIDYLSNFMWNTPNIVAFLSLSFKSIDFQCPQLKMKNESSHLLLSVNRLLE